MIKGLNIATIGTVLLVATIAKADRRMYWAECAPADYSKIVSDSQAGPAFGVHETPGSDVTLYCAVQDDTAFPKTAVTGINVHGHDGSSNGAVNVYACVDYYGSLGGACGVGATSGGPFTGDFTAQPSPSVWQSDGPDWGYVSVRLFSTDSNVIDFHGWYVY
jgi:hypothetical protein